MSNGVTDKCDLRRVKVKGAAYMLKLASEGSKCKNLPESLNYILVVYGPALILTTIPFSTLSMCLRYLYIYIFETTTKEIPRNRGLQYFSNR